MKSNIAFKAFIILAATSVGLATAATAQTAPPTDQAGTADAAASRLLGSQYIGATYQYEALHDGIPNHAQGAGVEFNQPWVDHLDLNLGYQWARANETGGRLTRQLVDLGGTTFADFGWGKPFLLGAVGEDWEHGPSANDHSLFYKLGLGVELPVAANFTLTPFANFVRATHFNQNEADFGVSAEFRVTRHWGIAATAQYDAVHRASDRTEYGLGINYHF